MHQVSLEEASLSLPQLIAEVSKGEDVILTHDSQPVARLVSMSPASSKKPRVPGSAKGLILYMAEDFDAPLDDFKEYME